MNFAYLGRLISTVGTRVGTRIGSLALIKYRTGIRPSARSMYCGGGRDHSSPNSVRSFWWKGGEGGGTEGGKNETKKCARYTTVVQVKSKERLRNVWSRGGARRGKKGHRKEKRAGVAVFVFWFVDRSRESRRGRILLLLLIFWWWLFGGLGFLVFFWVVSSGCWPVIGLVVQ